MGTGCKCKLPAEPERLPELVQPTMGPERIFVAPMKVQPGAVQAPTRESTFAPIFDGITSAATSIAKGIKPSYESPSPKPSPLGASDFNLSGYKPFTSSSPFGTTF